jgi:hypothetical protein
MRCRPSKRLSRKFTLGLGAVLGLSLLWSGPATAQQGHHQERMPNVMEYLDRLDRPERDQDQKPAQVVETLAIKPGMHLADLAQAPATSRGVLWKRSARPARSTSSISSRRH